MTEKVLGKIEKCSFGFGGYQDAEFGLYLSFNFKGSGIATFISGGWARDPDEHSKWTLEDQTVSYAKMVRRVRDTMTEAKVDDVSKLAGKPVEVEIVDNGFKSFRILTEVL